MVHFQIKKNKLPESILAKLEKYMYDGWHFIIKCQMSQVNYQN